MSDHRGGPVRSEAARIAILDATARLFAARGYDHLTVEGVAAEAKVSKQTIYRWWPSKGALVADCLLEGRLMPQRLVPPTSNDLRSDLAAWLRELFGLMETPVGESLVRSLIAAAADNPDVGRRIHESLGAASSLTERLQAGVDAGELRADAPLEAISEALVGALILRALSRSPASHAEVEQLIGAVLGGR